MTAAGATGLVATLAILLLFYPPDFLNISRKTVPNLEIENLKETGENRLLLSLSNQIPQEIQVQPFEENSSQGDQKVPVESSETNSSQGDQKVPVKSSEEDSPQEIQVEEQSSQGDQKIPVESSEEKSSPGDQKVPAESSEEQSPQEIQVEEKSPQETQIPVESSEYQKKQAEFSEEDKEQRENVPKQETENDTPQDLSQENLTSDPKHVSLIEEDENEEVGRTAPIISTLTDNTNAEEIHFDEPTISLKSVLLQNLILLLILSAWIFAIFITCSHKFE